MRTSRRAEQHWSSQSEHRQEWWQAKDTEDRKHKKSEYNKYNRKQLANGRGHQEALNRGAHGPMLKAGAAFAKRSFHRSRDFTELYDPCLCARPHCLASQTHKPAMGTCSTSIQEAQELCCQATLHLGQGLLPTAVRRVHADPCSTTTTARAGYSTTARHGSKALLARNKRTKSATSSHRGHGVWERLLGVKHGSNGAVGTSRQWQQTVYKNGGTRRANKSDNKQSQVVTAIHHSPLEVVLHPSNQALWTQPWSETKAGNNELLNCGTRRSVSIDSIVSGDISKGQHAGLDHVCTCR